MQQRKLGWKRDLPDPRDFKFGRHIVRPPRDVYPPLIDLRAGCSPVQDQLNLSSCVAHAASGHLQFNELQALKSDPASPEILDPNTYDNISRLKIYFDARTIDGDPGVDGGTQLRSAIMAVRNNGIARERDWPYDVTKVFTAPPASVDQFAQGHKVVSGYSLNNTDLNELKECLVQGFPFIFGMSLFESFMSGQVADTGIVPMPNTETESFEGGHALCCVGYDDSKQAFIVRNSWGTGWGLSGYCYIPYAYLTHSQLASDFWTLRFT